MHAGIWDEMCVLFVIALHFFTSNEKSAQNIQIFSTVFLLFI